VAFGVRAAVAPSIAARLREQCALLLEFLAAQLRIAQQAGQVSAQLDADWAARGLFALMDGLAMHALMRTNTAEQSLSVFDHPLDQVFSGSG
jgi:BetI-type transcriptional repressor, C-terminal